MPTENTSIFSFELTPDDVMQLRYKIENGRTPQDVEDEYLELGFDEDRVKYYVADTVRIIEKKKALHQISHAGTKQFASSVVGFVGLIMVSFGPAAYKMFAIFALVAGICGVLIYSSSFKEK
jgi:hypothetical protein